MTISALTAPAVMTGNSNTFTSGSFTVATGDAIIVGFSSATGSTAVTSITDSAGLTAVWFALPGAIRNSSPSCEMWVGIVTSGGTGTVTVNTSATDQTVVCVQPYASDAGDVFVGTQTSSAPTATADPSITLTRSNSSSWVVGQFSGNSADTFTAGTGNLRLSGTSTTVCGALVDNSGSGTVSVTHASDDWGIGAIELFDGGINYGNGAYSLGGTGTNGYLNGYNDFLMGRVFTTGSNAGGYTLDAVSVITDDANGGSAQFRFALYDDDGGGGDDLIAETNALAFGTPAGTGTPNIHTTVFTTPVTLTASTNYNVAVNNNDSNVFYRLDDTSPSTGATMEYEAAGQTFGAAPNPSGWDSTEASGIHVWVHVTAVSSAVHAHSKLRRFSKLKGLVG